MPFGGLHAGVDVRALRETDVDDRCPATFSVMAMSPVQTFSLVSRMVVDITAKNTTNGHNMPLLLLFRIVMSQRNLAFLHAEADTRALASYMTASFQSPKLEEAVKILAGAFRVAVRDLDITGRVKVRVSLGICNGCRCASWTVGGVHGVPTETVS